MTTDLLLLFGVAAAILFVAVVLIEGALRPGYDPTYHTGSELELGNRGWVQRANFLLMGAGGLAFGVGAYRALDTAVGAVLLGIFGLGLMVAGILPPDAVRGYPPGAPSEPSTKPTLGALVHAVIGGPVAFLAIFGACLNIAAHLQGAWRLYTLLTAVAGLTMTIWTALAFRRDAPNTGLVSAASSSSTGHGSWCWAFISSPIRPSAGLATGTGYRSDASPARPGGCQVDQVGCAHLVGCFC